MTDLASIKTRVEEAKGPDRELDRDIHQALGLDMNMCVHRAIIWNAYTASIDAALALADRVLGDGDWRWQRDYGGIITIAIGNPLDGWKTYQSARHVATDPLAFISALLSALSQKDTHNG